MLINGFSDLIKERQSAMDVEIRDLEELSDGEIAPTVRSEIKVVSNVIAANSSRAHLKSMDDDSDIGDDIDSDEEEPNRLKSIVVKTNKTESRVSVFILFIFNKKLIFRSQPMKLKTKMIQTMHRKSGH